MIYGSGYHYRSPFDEQMARLWYASVRRQPFPKQTIVITTGAPFPVQAYELVTVNTANVGHVGQLIDEARDGLCGWSASVIALCLLAYNCGLPSHWTIGWSLFSTTTQKKAMRVVWVYQVLLSW